MDGQRVNLKDCEKSSQNHLENRMTAGNIIPGGDQRSKDPRKLHRSRHPKDDHPCQNGRSRPSTSGSETIQNQTHKGECFITNEVHQKTRGLDVGGGQEERGVD